MKIEKYLTNKDITLTNDDIDTSRLIKDLQNGMVSEDEVNTRIENAKKEWEKSYADREKEATKTYADLEAKYNDLEKRNGDLTTSNAQLKLENVMTREGFKSENFKEIAQMRETLYGEEKDDEVAIQSIKEKFKSTYFPQEEKVITPVPNEAPIQKEQSSVPEPKITRNTSISSLFIKK